jgi:hypothetical protein
MKEESNREQYFLKWLFGERVFIREVVLNGEKEELEKSLVRNGCEHTLVASKMVKKTGGRGKYFGYEARSVKVYYIITSGPGFKTIDLKRELSMLGNFTSMEPGKISSRFELMVSPAAWTRNRKNSHPLQFKMGVSDFEEIPENGNDGCGFAAEKFFILWFGPKLGREIFAVQVRCFIPSWGWYKGMLMKSPYISTIQLPLSMQKVEKSTFKKCPGWAFLLVNATFPSAACTMMGRFLNPGLKAPPISYERNFIRLEEGDMYWSLLANNGVPEAVLEEYAQESSEFEGRKHYSVSNLNVPYWTRIELRLLQPSYLTNVSALELPILQDPCRQTLFF